MRDRRLVLIPIFLILMLLIFLWLRRDIQAYGPAAALCPGPDLYGYTCDGGGGYAYIDATNDTGLYADDDIITLDLPFPFTFYGTTYTEITASSNGTLQLGNSSVQFSNACLTPTPADGMGDLIAPFWDDLDLRVFGYLETEVVGETPNRIFVIEWDAVPLFGAEEGDTVTFAVQLFEETNDIVFLYEDTTTFFDSNGRSASIGIQSEAQGIALQYSCNQPVVANGARLLIRHPEQANADVGQQDMTMPTHVDAAPQAKGDLNDFLTALNSRGLTVLSQWQQHWRSQTPALQATWIQTDLTGSGTDDIILLRQGRPDQPQFSQIAIFTQTANGRYQLTADLPLSTRQQPFTTITALETADITGDGLADLLLQDGRTHQIMALTHHTGALQRMTVSNNCSGNLTLTDTTGDGIRDIVRSGCEDSPARQTVFWDGTNFVIQP